MPESVQENGYIDPPIPNFSAKWKRMLNFTLRPLYSKGIDTGTHRLEVWMGPGNELGAWENRRYLDFGRKRAPGLQNIDIAKHEKYDFNTISLSLY